MPPFLLISPSFPYFLPSLFLMCCAILPTSFGGKGPHLRRWLVAQPLHQTSLSWGFLGFSSAVRQMPGDLCTCVDMYVKIETERLNFIRFNQAKLRSEEYIPLRDAISTEKETQLMLVDWLFYRRHTQVAHVICMNVHKMQWYVRRYGRPDLPLHVIRNG